MELSGTETRRRAWTAATALGVIALVTAGTWALQAGGTQPEFEVIAAALPPGEAATTPEPPEHDEALAGTVSVSSPFVSSPVSSQLSSQHAAAPAVDRHEPSKTGSEPEPESDEAANTPDDQAFTYWDGDAQRTVSLVSGDPTVPDSRDPNKRRRSAGDASLAGARQAPSRGMSWCSALSRASRMTLGHSVVLVVDPDWSDADVRLFLARNRIGSGCVTPLDWLPNGFSVATDPGIAALELANALAPQDGVVLASPDWASELELE